MYTPCVKLSPCGTFPVYGNGGLFRALTSFTAVLRVNNSLIRRVRPASWPRNSLL